MQTGCIRKDLRTCVVTMTHQRQIKFRAFSQQTKMMYEPTQIHFKDGVAKVVVWSQFACIECEEQSQSFSYDPVMQFTGLHDKHGKEVYESDIFRVEEDNPEDMIYYLVIVWVQEWCMFCTLTANEYHAYQTEGIKALDEPMFWTYTLEDTNDRRFFLCGNIHSNPELLKP